MNNFKINVKYKVAYDGVCGEDEFDSLFEANYFVDKNTDDDSESLEIRVIHPGNGSIISLSEWDKCDLTWAMVDSANKFVREIEPGSTIEDNFKGEHLDWAIMDRKTGEIYGK